MAAAVAATMETVVARNTCNKVVPGFAVYLHGKPDIEKERRMDARCLVFTVLALSGMPVSGNPLVNNYDALRAAAVSTCQAVDAGEYQTGLFFNPDGYRSYYARSLCYQNAAITFRDIKLCDLVRQRRALFSSSWGYSKSNCKKLVSEGIAKDRETIDRMRQDYEQGHVQLAGFRIERDGNGRDIDIIPEFSGEWCARLRVAL